MLNPDLLLLDEPSLGLSPKAVKKSFETIRNISAQFSASIIIVEQNVKAVLEIANKVYAMRLGKIVLEDRPGNVTPDVLKRAFLGN